MPWWSSMNLESLGIGPPGSVPHYYGLTLSLQGGCCFGRHPLWGSLGGAWWQALEALDNSWTGDPVVIWDSRQ